MSKLPLKPDPSRFGLEEFSDLLPRRVLDLGETANSFAGFRTYFLRELAPETPYEFVVAESIIATEWDILQERQLRERAVSKYVEYVLYRDFLLANEKRKARTAIVSRIDDFERKLANKKDVRQLRDLDQDGVLQIAQDLLGRARSSDPNTAKAAIDEFTERGLNVLDLMSEARERMNSNHYLHDNRIEQLEQRRRQIYADYQRLIQSRPIENAELIDVD